MIIQPIVEGHGECSAVPVLIRRICYELGHCVGAQIASPIRVPRSKMVMEAHFKHYLQIAGSQPGQKMILLFMDADDDCTKEIAERTRPWIEEEATCGRCELIVIPKEYECWFIAVLESLRGVRGISNEARSHNCPERVRNPKAILTHWMEGTTAYNECADQAALTQMMDLNALRDRCRSFQ
ncbi:MAG: DUF4276 family protein, partial [Terracidiphilus sp.]